MIREVKFESQDRRIKQIIAALNENGIKDIEEANAICEAAGLDPYKTCEETQPICFENAKWAYVVGSAIALKKGCKNAAEAAEAIGIGLQAFCIPGSVADDRKVGIGHGNLAAMLLREETKCFAFLAGHESFAAAEGAIKIAAKADKVRKEPLRCILNGLGKDAAQIISRINGFTYVQTEFDYFTGELKVVREIAYSDGPRAKVKCYGADDVREGVAIMWKEGVDVSITGNSTNPTRFQHPVAGTYKKERVLAGKPYFSVASGGGTGRTLHPDNMAAGPASYGMTDTMGRMHSDAQFAGSSSVPAHVEMMGFLGIGNNPMVGCTVACAVDVATALVRAARLSACTERRRLCPLCSAIIFRLRERSIVVVTVGFTSSFLPKIPKNPFRFGFLGCSCTLFCTIAGTWWAIFSLKACCSSSSLTIPRICCSLSSRRWRTLSICSAG